MRRYTDRGRRFMPFPVFPLYAAVVVVALAVYVAETRENVFLRIRNWETGEILAETPASAGGKLFFGWTHSLEHIPWNEYYHIDENLHLILDTITFPAFGAGIPENKGKVCRVEGGLIYMEEINQEFNELIWLNSSTATREIKLDDKFETSGGKLPNHVKLRMRIERDGDNGAQ
jgi:hypothetical protein